LKALEDLKILEVKKIKQKSPTKTVVVEIVAAKLMK
jgi:hypothetical protein